MIIYKINFFINLIQGFFMPQININDVINNINLIRSNSYDFDEDNFGVDTLEGQIDVNTYGDAEDQDFDCQSYLTEYLTILSSLQYTFNNISNDTVDQLNALITNIDNDDNFSQSVSTSITRSINIIRLQIENELIVQDNESIEQQIQQRIQPDQVHQAQQPDNGNDTDNTGDTVDDLDNHDELDVPITGNSHQIDDANI